ncbi:MAG: integration host factor subunit beta [Planctomycetaceae bacterium]|nr:MAG: integration host factor subunit beta [Planctomycetaceae bacterium]
MATTKKDLIDRIAQSTGDTHVVVKAVIHHLFQEITAQLAQGNRIELRDFGVFETKTTPARTAQNPRTLKKVEVPAKRRVVFKPSRLMRQRLNGHVSKPQGIADGQDH